MKLTTILATALLAISVQVSASVTPPQELIESTSNQVLDVLRKDKEDLAQNPAKMYDLINQLVIPHFDFERISRWVLGKYWRRASTDEQKRFVDEFRTLLVRTYGKALLEYTDYKINYLPIRQRVGDTEVTVRSEVEQPGSFPIPVDYDVYLKDGAWKVYDVKIDSISLVANYRTTFGNEISRTDIKSMIDGLAKRNQEAQE